MTNIDFNMALENIQELRSQIEFYSDLRSESIEDGDKETFDSCAKELGHLRLKLDFLYRELAEIMLILKQGYDLALIPKAGVK